MDEYDKIYLFDICEFLFILWFSLTCVVWVSTYHVGFGEGKTLLYILQYQLDVIINIIMLLKANIIILKIF